MRTHRDSQSAFAAVALAVLVLLLALVLAACGTNNGSGNASGGATATPGASATMVAMHGKSNFAEGDISTVFHLNAGDTIRVSYRFRAGAPIPLSMIILDKYNPSDATVEKVETLKLKGQRKGTTTWTVTDAGSYLVAVGTTAATYRVTVVKL